MAMTWPVSVRDSSAARYTAAQATSDRLDEPEELPVDDRPRTRERFR